MRDSRNLPADTFPGEKLAAVDAQLSNAGLMRPNLLHFAVGVAISLIALALTIYAGSHLVKAALSQYYDSLLIVASLFLIICFMPKFWLQLLALFSRSRRGAFSSAIIQGFFGFGFLLLSLPSIVELFQHALGSHDPRDFAMLTVPVLLILGTVLNVCWHIRLSDNDVRPSWILRYQLSELAAITTGFCIAAAIIAPFFNR